MKTVAIVVAWVETVHVVVRARRADMGERPVMREEREGRAVVWLNAGTPADVASARAYAALEGYAVYTYPASEPDPLGRARADVLRAAGVIGAQKAVL